MADPTITGTGAVKRAEFKLFADVGEAESPEWELQGDRIEELSLELNPNVETVTDVTGVTATTLDKYEEQTSVEPYYAKRESKLFAWLYSVVRDKKTLTDVEKTFCCVNIFAESEGKYDAWTQKAIVAVQSYGGSTKGLQLPYNIHWIGERTYGAAAITAGKLTFMLFLDLHEDTTFQRMISLRSRREKGLLTKEEKRLWLDMAELLELREADPERDRARTEFEQRMRG